MQKTIAAVAVAGILMSACSGEPPAPPSADKKATTLELHGDVRIDNYFWLRERDNPKVVRYLEEENRYADAVLADSSGLQQRLVDEMKARIAQHDQSAPYRHGDYFYYHRYEEGFEYPLYCRRKGSLDAPEEVLLDVNALAGDAKYFSVRGVSVSPDHKTLGYGVDTIGRRFYDLHFVDLESGQPIDQVVEQVTPWYEWAADGRTIVYARQDRETLRWYQAYALQLGGEPELLYQEDDEAFWVSPSQSLSGRFIYLNSTSTTSTEIRYLPTADPSAAALKVFLPREEDHEYFVTDGGDRFYVLSNDGAENFQVLETSLDDTSKEAWHVVVAERRDVLINDITVLSGHIVLGGMHEGLTVIEVVDRGSGESHSVEFEEQAYSAFSGDNYEYDTTVFRYDYESMTTPETVYDYDLDERTHALIREEPVLGGFDRSNYMTERRFATARDGTRVPVTLVYRKGLRMDGENPLLQYGYGSYGSSIEPWFSDTRLSLLDRGFIFAIAHIRGGSEMGRQWYFDGRQLNKLNTFYDFIDVSNFLIKEGYTSPEHLYARGGSAGGLLMGAIANMAPELYNGISTRVPFVDVVTTMLDESIPLTTGEFDEWGNPQEKAFHDYMLSYSPYDQVAAQDYPHIMVTTGLHDSQVQYWEPAKWVAKLRELKTDDNLLLLKTDMQAGHSGKTGRFKSLEDEALYYTFFLMLEGIDE